MLFNSVEGVFVDHCALRKAKAQGLVVCMFQQKVGVRSFTLQSEACLKFHGYIRVNCFNGKLGVMRVVTGQWGLARPSSI